MGFHVDMKHLAPTLIGQKVTAKVVLQEVKDGRFRFAVEAVNERGVKIGEGSHRRATIKIEELLKAGS